MPVIKPKSKKRKLKVQLQNRPTNVPLPRMDVDNDIVNELAENSSENSEVDDEDESRPRSPQASSSVANLKEAHVRLVVQYPKHIDLSVQAQSKRHILIIGLPKKDALRLISQVEENFTEGKPRLEFTYLLSLSSNELSLNNKLRYDLILIFMSPFCTSALDTAESELIQIDPMYIAQKDRIMFLLWDIGGQKQIGSTLIREFSKRHATSVVSIFTQDPGSIKTVGRMIYQRAINLPSQPLSV